MKILTSITALPKGIPKGNEVMDYNKIDFA